MKILLVIDSLGSGGAQRQLVNLALGLHSRGHSIDFFVYYPQYQHFASVLREQQIPVHFYKKQKRFSFNVIFALRRLLKSKKIDVAISFLQVPSFYCGIACIGLPTRSIASERFCLPSNISLYLRTLVYCYKFSDHLVTNSFFAKKQIVGLFPSLTKKTSVITNGIDLKTFFPQKQCDSNLNSLVAIGTVNARKNILNCIKAFVICKTKYQINLSMSWVGKIEDREVYENACQQIEEWQLEWQWLGERKDIVAILNRHKVLIHPSFAEGFCNVICEALACGIPVLASDVSDNAWLLQNGRHGEIFSPHEPEDIASVIYKFFQQKKEKYQKMQKDAYLFATQHLSLENFVQAYENLIQDKFGIPLR